jgi:hypothetical protein
MDEEMYKNKEEYYCSRNGQVCVFCSGWENYFTSGCPYLIIRKKLQNEIYWELKEKHG